ncbi:MAG: NYN domain-containing protein [Deltaproteobacteria bacterium]|nr:NYN domain-containing protein [Deltaproteobacteria bacterium]
MSTNLIIDGYNLIGLDRDIEAGRERLIEDLIVYKKAVSVRITVVFDGTLSGSLTRGNMSRSGINIVFSRAGEQADAIIKEMAHRIGSGATVVTSDRDVSAAVRSFGAVVVESVEFRRVLDEALYEDIKGAVSEDETYDSSVRKKGNPRRLPKADRLKQHRLDKLRKK